MGASAGGCHNSLSGSCFDEQRDIVSANGDSASGRKPERSLLEAIVNVGNMFNAEGRVITNRRSAGIGGMIVEELNEYLDDCNIRQRLTGIGVECRKCAQNTYDNGQYRSLI